MDLRAAAAALAFLLWFTDPCRGLTAVAIDTLVALMGRRMPPNVRLGAARTVAELGIHQNDAETILRRLDEIEACQRQQDALGR